MHMCNYYIDCGNIIDYHQHMTWGDPKYNAVGGKGMAIRELEFRSFNERDNIQAWIYTPTKTPRAIVQIVHGLGEHSRRYLHMILKMLDAGFIVCADDHVGHGKTAHNADTWGDFGNKGYMTTAEDEHILRNLVTKEFSGLPYFMYGHSWGSMIARNYTAHYGENMAGLIICGTIADNPELAALADTLKQLVDSGRGSDVEPEYMAGMFAGWVDRYPDAKSPMDWVASDEGVVKDHGSDPFNSFESPNIQSLYDIVQLFVMDSGTQWAEKIPKELPLYVISGDQDPAGNYGEGVYAVSNWLSNTGHKDLKTRLYSGYRHEIHNEPDIRDEVVEGIIQFIENNLAK